MRHLFRWTMLLMSLLLLLSFDFHASADHGRRGKHKHHGERRAADDRDKPYRTNSAVEREVTNEKFKEHCGACHFVYQPWLLPSASWIKLLSNLKDHFGQTVDIDTSSKGIIEKYLTDNAAEKSQLKRSRKIMRCLRGDTPVRITEVPYIRRKHHDIAAEVFTRKTVGSMSNCSGCHKTADQGIYEDDYVTIPK